MRLVSRLLSGLVLLVVVFAILVIVIAPYTFLPNRLESTVASALQTRLGASTPPDVSLDSDPQWRMLTGDFSDGTVALGAPDIVGIRPDSVKLALDPFDVQVVGSVTRGALLTEAPITGTVEAQFSENTLSEIAAADAEQYPVRGVAIEGQLLRVEAETEVLGVIVPVSVGGTPDVQGHAFIFRPEDIRAMGIPVPDEITQSLLAGTTFKYPLGELPYGIQMDNARVEGDRLVITGMVSDVTVELATK
jgi:hypothetical protein